MVENLGICGISSRTVIVVQFFTDQYLEFLWGNLSSHSPQRYYFSFQIVYSSLYISIFETIGRTFDRWSSNVYQCIFLRHPGVVLTFPQEQWSNRDILSDCFEQGTTIITYRWATIWIWSVITKPLEITPRRRHLKKKMFHEVKIGGLSILQSDNCPASQITLVQTLPFTTFSWFADQGVPGGKSWFRTQYICKDG
jgi:hypothetical protein